MFNDIYSKFDGKDITKQKELNIKQMELDIRQRELEIKKLELELKLKSK